MSIFTYRSALAEAKRFQKCSVPAALSFPVLAALGEDKCRNSSPELVIETSVSKTDLASIIRTCRSVEVQPEGKRIHAYCVKNGHHTKTYYGNLLMEMYIKCGLVEDARIVFERLPEKNAFSWVVLIVELSKRGVAQGKFLHAGTMCSDLRSDVVLDTSLVNMYGKWGFIEDARSLFDKMLKRDVVLWTTMISVYAQYGHGQYAVELLRQMQSKDVLPNKITFLVILQAFHNHEELPDAKRMHACIVSAGLEQDVSLLNALLNMYAKCMSFIDVRQMFDKMTEKNVTTWNTMISIYIQCAHAEEALQIFQKMQHEDIKPNEVTFASTVSACANLIDLVQGKLIHSLIMNSEHALDVVIGNALVNMYCKCGHLEDASWVFDRMLERDVISWTAMVVSYNECGQGKKALDIFQEMQIQDVVPNRVTLISVLSACANQAAIDQGMQTHIRIIDSGFDLDLVVGNALINMYGKCGCLIEARRVFNKMSMEDVISWNAIIEAYAEQGHAQESLEIFYQMQLEGIRPNEITYVSILSACSHAGLFSLGLEYFICISQEQGIVQSMEHYGCIIDLLCHAGQLDVAKNLIVSMPFQPTTSLWRTYLGACGNESQGTWAAGQLSSLDPKDSSSYVLLSNILATSNKWDTECETVPFFYQEESQY